MGRIWKCLCAIVLLIVGSSLVYGITVCAATGESTVTKSFKEHEVVPDVIPVAPDELVHVQYPSGVNVSEGNVLTPTQVKDKPTVTWDAAPDQFYTLAMTDPDVPSRENRSLGEWHHWLVGNVPGSNVECGDTLAEYVGSGPSLGTGLHRYVFLIYKQPGNLTFDEPRLNNTSTENRNHFSIAKFATKYNLSDPVAGNLFRAEYDDYVPILLKQLGE